MARNNRNLGLLGRNNVMNAGSNPNGNPDIYNNAAGYDAAPFL